MTKETECSDSQKPLSERCYRCVQTSPSASLPSPSPSVTPLPRGEALTKGKRRCKTKAPHSKAAGRIDHAPRSAERTCPATARPGCWRYKMPQAVSTDLPGTPEALPLGELAAKQTERAIKGYTSSRKSLGVSFFEENATVPTHRRCTLLSVKR